ncbi:MAG: glycoside hydrolase family 99-like domain-containing protein [Candidatus Hydrogenedens sp.]
MYAQYHLSTCFCIKIFLLFLVLFYFTGRPCFSDETSQGKSLPIKNSRGDYTVACFYFPNYHIDKRNEKVHGQNWTEWELVKNARPRFSGHQQPKIPLWGYVDEADPKVMEMKIDSAAEHGIDVFLFDWYWYNDGPFLQRCLDEGYLKARNHNRVRFAVMWANHTWINIHPASLAKIQSPEVLYPGEVTPETFEQITNYVIDKYFSDPAYWTIYGKPVFSIYEIHTFVDGVGGLEMAKKSLDNFQKNAIAKGFPGVHINVVNIENRMPKCVQGKMTPAELIHYLTIDSVTSYAWVLDTPLNTFPETPYTEVANRFDKIWAERSQQFTVPYFPNVSMGWDSSPRCKQDDPFENKGYPFTPILSGNTPEQFQSALEKCRTFLDNNPICNKTLTINAWNEWTEGSYLEPDTVHGYAYLQAIKNIFGR